MKNKKGFTLVELLAVIAILAILVIIAIPNVLNLYRNSRRNVFKSDVQSIIKATEQAYVMNSMNNGNRTCFDSVSSPLDIDAKENLIYVVKLSNKGKIISIQIADNNYQILVDDNNGIEKDEIGKLYEIENRENKLIVEGCSGSAIVHGEEKNKPKYTEEILHGTDPVLGSSMIPVKIKDNGEVTYADVYNSTNKWYSYNDKQWANSVILVDNPSKKYKVGDTISESDIRAYFVWIPKYKYKLFNMGDYTALETTQPTIQVQEIDIVFGTENTKENDGVECVTPMTSGGSGSCAKGEYMTHPAFLSIPSNGFWVGKFETGYNQNSDVTLPITSTSAWSTAKAEINEVKPNNIIIKPNVYSWRNSTIYNFFMSAYNFNRNLDSHMMKNTEWGAVAYLSHSKYGIKNEVRINNNSNNLTGYAASEKDGASSTDSTKTLLWNTTTGKLASTTGNISGIYDMSGVAYENMASYLDGNVGSSEMDTIVKNSTYSKYIDKYSSSSTVTSYKYRILGDATGELGPFWNNNGSYNQSTWFADFSAFVDSYNPWFARGGHKGDTTLAGQFNFHRSTGRAYNYGGVRLILTPTN